MIIKKISLSRFKSFNLKKLSLETRLLCIELFIILFVLILAILSSSILFQTAIKNRSQEFSTWSCPYKTGHSAFATSRINSLGDFSLNPLWG